ncbi:MAG: hypothetical protein RIC14_00370 [Filomicrobium sp.]
MRDLESAPNAKPICIGLWMPFGPGTNWRGEGIARTIVFLLNGLATQGLLGTRVKIKIYTTAWLIDDVRDSLEELIGVQAKTIEYVEVESVAKRTAKLEAIVSNVAGVIFFPFVMFGKLRRRDKKPKALRRENVSLWSLMRYHRRGGYGSNIEDDVKQARPLATPADSKVGKVIRRIPFVRRVLPSITTLDEAGYALAAAKLDKKSGVDVWWAINPAMFGLEFLPKPLVVNFWDFASGEFGFLWPPRDVDIFQRRLQAATSNSTHLITQSLHNYNLKLAPCFGVERSRVSIVYLAHPDHYAELIRSFDETRVRSAESRAEASRIIQEHVRKLLKNINHAHFASRGIDLSRLLSFDFATQPYVVISTQNRPYKNLLFAVKAFLKMVSEKSIDARLILTSPFDLADDSDKIAEVIHSQNAYDRVFCLPRVPEDVHASLYHCARATVHPSLSEGGVSAYPFLEGMVMGCPGLIARADYTVEGNRLHSDYDSILFDVMDDGELIEKLAALIEDSDGGYRAQKPIFDEHGRWNWEYASVEYLRVMLRAAGRDDAWLDDFGMPSSDKKFAVHPFEWNSARQQSADFEEAHQISGIFAPDDKRKRA